MRLTQSSDKNNNDWNKNTEDSFGCEICDYLNTELKKYIPPNIDIYLPLYVPVENPNKYKKGLCNQIKEMLLSDVKVNKKKIYVSGFKIEVSFLPRNPERKKRIVCTIINKIANENVDVLSNAEAILKNSILKKNKKCKNIKSPKWLALSVAFKDDYWLADHKIFIRAYNNISRSIQHDFDRILIVEDTKKVYCIFSKA